MHRSTGSQTADFLDANIALWLAKPAVPVCDRDHRRISVAVAITLRGLDQLLDLALG
jgi:hypothetical protein